VCGECFTASPPTDLQDHSFPVLLSRIPPAGSSAFRLTFFECRRGPLQARTDPPELRLTHLYETRSPYAIGPCSTGANEVSGGRQASVSNVSTCSETYLPANPCSSNSWLGSRPLQIQRDSEQQKPDHDRDRRTKGELCPIDVHRGLRYSVATLRPRMQ
jgi:hypothetical protein